MTGARHLLAIAVAALAAPAQIESHVAATGSTRTTAKGNVPQEAFGPGSYALQFVVRDMLAKELEGVATQWIDFDVVP